MALDRQISLFKVDTNAFLTKEEQNHYNTFIQSLKDLKESYTTEDRVSIKKTDERYNEYRTQVNELKKNYKEYILASAKKHEEDNRNNECKDIRSLNKSYLVYTDKEGKTHTNLRNVVSMFESTLSRSFNIEINNLTLDIFIVEIYH